MKEDATMEDMVDLLSETNAITAVLVLVVVASALQGSIRGTSQSARHFMHFVAEGVITAAALLAAWGLAGWLSGRVQAWLIAQNIRIPDAPMNQAVQLFYTLVTGIRDFPVLRYGIVFLIAYLIVKQIIYSLFALGWRLQYAGAEARADWKENRLISGIGGATIGSVIGTARALVLIAALFIYSSWFPNAPMASYIQESAVYKQGAARVIEPVTGEWVQKLPVFTRAVEEEFAQILQRRYEVVDANVPDDIAAAANEITASAQNDEEKAKALYRWVGTRVRYDWEKVRMYEEERIWKEQTPEDTFESRLGVCIDYSRLYAVMARSVGLQVKVVTGLGYDGKGGYGPHAWNEVYLPEEDRWAPLDSTWVSSGGNWFDPPDFDKTHLRDAV
jgi:transglutaminase-like putative cysteine protease